MGKIQLQKCWFYTKQTNKILGQSLDEDVKFNEKPAFRSECFNKINKIN